MDLEKGTKANKYNNLLDKDCFPLTTRELRYMHEKNHPYRYANDNHKCASFLLHSKTPIESLQLIIQYSNDRTAEALIVLSFIFLT